MTDDSILPSSLFCSVPRTSTSEVLWRRRRVITAHARLGPVDWNMFLPASTGGSTRLAGTRKVVSVVMAAVCCSGTLKVGRRYDRPCGADAFDVVSDKQIGKREEPTTND
jgi:hypothetical protein